MFLRRFDIEQTFRLFKQTPGRTAPTIRTPQAADRWTAMIVAVYPNSAWPGTWPRTSAGLGMVRRAGPADPGPGSSRPASHTCTSPPVPRGLISW